MPVYDESALYSLNRFTTNECNNLLKHTVNSEMLKTTIVDRYCNATRRNAVRQRMPLGAFLILSSWRQQHCNYTHVRYGIYLAERAKNVV